MNRDSKWVAKLSKPQAEFNAGLSVPCALIPWERRVEIALQRIEEKEAKDV